jgi:hypothetical protein
MGEDEVDYRADARMEVYSVRCRTDAGLSLGVRS